MDLTRARIEIRRLDRMEAQAWPQLATAVHRLLLSLPGMERRPTPLRPEAFDALVRGFLERTAGNPLLLGLEATPLTRKARAHLGVRRLARVKMHVEGRAAESGYVVLELRIKASRRRWRFDQVIVPIVLSRHTMQRYLMRCGQDLGHLQTSLDAALLSMKAWLRVAADHPEVLPVSVAVPIDSGAVLGFPYIFRACEPWSHRIECSRGGVRSFDDDDGPMLGVSLRTFIHEDMYSALQEEKIGVVRDLGGELLATLRERGLSQSEALASPAPGLAAVMKTLFAATTDRAWRAAFSCPAEATAHALLSYDQ